MNHFTSSLVFIYSFIIIFFFLIWKSVFPSKQFSVNIDKILCFLSERLKIKSEPPTDKEKNVQQKWFITRQKCSLQTIVLLYLERGEILKWSKWRKKKNVLRKKRNVLNETEKCGNDKKNKNKKGIIKIEIRKYMKVNKQTNKNKYINK